MARFDYLLERIADAPFLDAPFRHIYIQQLFTKDDFAELLVSADNAIPAASSDAELIQRLFDAGYRVIEFPGCITDKRAYLAWRTSHQRPATLHSACEQFGMAFRLIEARSTLCRELNQFLTSGPFKRALASKFDIDADQCDLDAGMQKYLDGYEISPHADVRRKALTFMVNVNPHAGSERLTHHTHLLRFKEQYRYVQTLWEGNEQVERCWVPWRWCETEATQNQNNTMLVFAPSNETMHGVKASYDHLPGQRTQLYGNLWYRRYETLKSVEWEQLDILGGARKQRPRTTLKRRLLAAIPPPTTRLIKRTLAALHDKELTRRNH